MVRENFIFHGFPRIYRIGMVSASQMDCKGAL